MTVSEQAEPKAPATGAAVGRRALIAGAAAVGIGVAAAGLTKASQAATDGADGTRQPEADSGHDYPMPAPHAKNGLQFWQGVVGPATLSAAASRIAVGKATDADTRQFANFELREAVAVVAIIKSLGVPTPPMSEGGKELLQTLETALPGADFDKIYINAELANHEFLRDLAESYLKNRTENRADAAEKHDAHLAALALTAFKEHVVLSKNIVHALTA